MKQILSFFLVLLLFVSCSKKSTKTPSFTFESKSTSEAGPKIGATYKWICIGGDSVFTDTLVLTIAEVSWEAELKNRSFYYNLSYPIWDIKDYCTLGPLTSNSTINFLSSNHKKAIFKLIP